MTTRQRGDFPVDPIRARFNDFVKTLFVAALLLRVTFCKPS